MTRGPLNMDAIVAEAKRRLERAPAVFHSIRVGADWLPDWLDDEEFEQLAELMQHDGLPVETEECQAVLRRAWRRRAHKEPRKINAGLLLEEGRVEEYQAEMERQPRLSDEEREERAARVNAAIDERLRGSQLEPRGDTNFNWRPASPPKRSLGA